MDIQIMLAWQWWCPPECDVRYAARYSGNPWLSCFRYQKILLDLCSAGF